MDDAFNLQRFVDAQSGLIDRVYAELQSGQESATGCGSFFRRSPALAAARWRRTSLSDRYPKLPLIFRTPYSDHTRPILMPSAAKTGKSTTSPFRSSACAPGTIIMTATSAPRTDLLMTDASVFRPECRIRHAPEVRRMAITTISRASGGRGDATIHTAVPRIASPSPCPMGGPGGRSRVDCHACSASRGHRVRIRMSRPC